MVAVGFWTQRKATNQEQFLVAGRSVGPLLYSGTLAAIIIGGGATIGGVKLGYTYGISGMWLVSMYGLGMIDRKSTRLNSSHLVISYAVFCLKKKNKT